MIGWDADGNEVTLLSYQIEYVKALLSDRSVIMLVDADGVGPP